MNRPLPVSSMTKYQCHKQVHAVKIAGMEIMEDKSAKIMPANESLGIFATQPGWADRFNGDYDDPGYYVVYADGFASWSPTKAFEDGYTEIK